MEHGMGCIFIPFEEAKRIHPELKIATDEDIKKLIEMSPPISRHIDNVETRGNMTNEFFDDFKNLNNWINFGSPSPYTRNSKYYVNGDGWYASGSYSKQKFRIHNGLVLEFMALQSPGNVWDMFYHVGFGKDYHYTDKHVPYAITFGIYGKNPDRDRRYDNAIVCRVDNWKQKLLAGLNDGKPHVYKIEFENDNVLFYRDNTLLYKCHNQYLGQNLPLLIAGRSYHKGSNWIEYIRVYNKYNLKGETMSVFSSLSKIMGKSETKAGVIGAGAGVGLGAVAGASAGSPTINMAGEGGTIQIDNNTIYILLGILMVIAIAIYMKK